MARKQVHEHNLWTVIGYRRCYHITLSRRGDRLTSQPPATWSRCGGICGNIDAELNRVFFAALRMMPPELAALHNHVGSLFHVPHEEHGSSVARFQRFQAALEWVTYNPSQNRKTSGAGALCPRASWVFKPGPRGRPMTTQREDGLSHTFKACYNFTVKADREETLTTVRTVFEEHDLIRCTYTDEALYSRVGEPLSRVLDVALAKGDPETAVETLYSVMGGQHKDGGQSNDTLVNRTKVNWSVSSVVAVPELIGRSAKRHLETSRPPMSADGVARYYSGVAEEGQSPHPEVGRTSDEVRSTDPAPSGGPNPAADCRACWALCDLCAPRHPRTTFPHTQWVA